MFIPYEDIGQFIFKYTKNENLNKFFYEKKISQNLDYIKKNYSVVKEKLKEKFKSKNISVIFYIYDETKWKCQALYDLLKEDNRFNVSILATKNSVKDINNPNFQKDKELEKVFQFFEQRGMNVKMGYDTVKKEHIPIKNFNPDIIIYQHPWYVERSQGPVVASEFAITYYVPYYIPSTTSQIDYYLRFHSYVENYCVFDELTYNEYVKKMSNKGANLIVTGQPYLDYFTKNEPVEEKQYVIYAPHWTILKKGVAYSTFEWSGKYMLEYAKQHPDSNWVFKPHPLLYKELILSGYMKEAEVKDYYDEWATIGLKYESGDYLKLFKESKLMITDCGSFLGEYFFTGKPLIHLISQDAQPYNETINNIIKYYYKAHNLTELETYMKDLISEKDMMKQERQEAIEKYTHSNASIKIKEDIISKLT